MIMWFYHFVLSHLSVDKHLDHFHFESIMNNVAVYSCIQEFLWSSVFNDLKSSNSMFSSLRNGQAISNMAVQVTFLPEGCECSNSASCLPTLLITF